MFNPVLIVRTNPTRLHNAVPLSAVVRIAETMNGSNIYLTDGTRIHVEESLDKILTQIPNIYETTREILSVLINHGVIA